MATTTQMTTDQIAAQRDAFADKVAESLGGMMQIHMIYIGNRFGFYRALAREGPLSSVDLAHRSGTNERYVREWLEYQTITGVLTVDDPARDPTERQFSIPGGHVPVLADEEDVNYLAPLAQLGVGLVHPFQRLLRAFQTGEGIPFEDYGIDLLEGQAGQNRNLFLYELPSDILPAIPDIHNRLQADPPARIADIGCGFGWSSIGLAKNYPDVQVDGYDLDKSSIERAQANATAAGLDERVRFHHKDAGDPALGGTYDLVTAFECIHDMPDPVSVLKTMRRLANENGTVLVMDERVGDEFTGQDESGVEFLMYGFSVLHCLPVGLADQPSVGTGTVMRTNMLRQYARNAGFSDIEVLPIDNVFFRFYRLV